MTNNPTRVLQTNPTTEQHPFQVTFLNETDGLKAAFNPNSVIFKSFNLKDVMISQTAIDQKTQDTIFNNEGGSLDRHIIKNINQKIKIFPNQVLYIKIKVSSNLNPIEATIEAGPKEAENDIKTKSLAWEAFPELIEFSPKMEFDVDGKLKNPFAQRFQSYAYVPIGYFTSNENAPITKTVFFSKPSAISQTYVQLLKTNLIINTFNYDGYPVLYFTPAIFSYPYLQLSTGT